VDIGSNWLPATMSVNGRVVDGQTNGHRGR
jgi:hypothetical protein